MKLTHAISAYIFLRSFLLQYAVFFCFIFSSDIVNDASTKHGVALTFPLNSVENTSQMHKKRYDCKNDAGKKLVWVHSMHFKHNANQIELGWSEFWMIGYVKTQQRKHPKYSWHKVIEYNFTNPMWWVEQHFFEILFQWCTLCIH